MAKAPSFPTRAEALASAIQGLLASVSDGLVRVDCIPLIDFGDLFQQLDPDQELRIAILAPFQYSTERANSTSDPKVVTKWRNESIRDRRASPAVVFGTGMGTEEAGLKKIVVIRENDVLAEYERLGERWLTEHVADQTEAPGRLFHALVQMARERLVDSCELSRVCFDVLSDPTKAHVRPQKELWRLGLLPDARAQDSTSPGGRLSLNLSVAEFLRSAPDSGADQKKWDRLRQRAAEGNKTAQGALAFAASKDRKLLKDLDLDSMQAALATLGSRSRKKKDEESEPRTVDFFDFLDLGVDEDQAMTAELQDLVDLDAQEISETLEVDEATELRIAFKRREPLVRLRGDPDAGQGLEDDAEEGESEGDIEDSNGGRLATERVINSQVLVTIRRLNSDDALKTLTGGHLAEVAQLTATMLPHSGADADFVGLVRDYLRKRTALLALDSWGEHLVELLILDPNLLSLAEAYLRSWQVLVEEALKSPSVAYTSQLREFLGMLDGDWSQRQPDEVSFVACRLFPTHPFVLSPAVEIARYARSNPGVERLGEQVEWAIDRTCPAYPAVWEPSGQLLLHAGGSTSWPSFEIKPEATRPPVSRGRGVVNIVRSYLGLHPFAVAVHQRDAAFKLEARVGQRGSLLVREHAGRTERPGEYRVVRMDHEDAIERCERYVLGLQNLHTLLERGGQRQRLALEKLLQEAVPCRWVHGGLVIRQPGPLRE